MSVLYQQCQSGITIKMMVIQPSLAEWDDNASWLQ